MTTVDLRHHRADYGYDGDYRKVSAPAVATTVGTVSAGLLASAGRSLVRGKPVAAAVTGGAGASIITTAALFIRTTRVGKFEVWAQLLDDLGLHGDETLLDMGCGRGAVLLAAAKLLPNGRAIGVDIFYTNHYIRQLRGLGWTDARRRNLGWRMWWGPEMGTHVVTATKPA
jgi:hypothetical protein